MRAESIMKWVIAAVLVAVIGSGILVVYRFINRQTVQIGTYTLEVTVARTDLERQQGLSNTPELADGQGMLFVFDTADKWGIWMKDMNYPLDILWLDDGKKVVHIEDNVSPDSYPKTYKPKVDARYILEVPSGFAAEHHVTLGTLTSFTLR